MKHLFEFNSFENVTIKVPTEKEFEEFIADAEVSNEADDSLLHMPYSKEGRYLAAFVGNKIAGMMCFTPTMEDTKIEVIIIDDRYRAQKIGTKLVQAVMDLDKTGTIVANPFTDESEQFFTKLGFIMDEDYDESDPNTMIFLKFAE